MDFALQEAEERLSHLERDCEKLDSNIREGVKDLYTKFILSRENSTTDLSLCQLKTIITNYSKNFSNLD
jgi:hypothetical protein